MDFAMCVQEHLGPLRGQQGCQAAQAGLMAELRIRRLEGCSDWKRERIPS